MNSPKSDPLLPLALELTDELPIDWDGERAARPDVVALLRELESLERLATVQRAARQRTRGIEARFLWGPLRVTSKLGEGGFAEVWRAFDPALEREVALKLRHPDRGGNAGARRWLDEGRRLARIRHRNVVAVLGADVHDGRAGIWTELIEGRTLEQWVAAEGTLGAREAALLGLDLCGALAAIHGAGLLHGDIKASNVMREAGGRVVLMDLGAGVEQAAVPGASATVESASPLTAAPEVLAGKGASVRSDLWSLGALLFRMVAGQLPVQGGDADAIRHAHRQRERVALRDLRPDLPADFISVVEKCLAWDPVDRYASAGALESALAQLLALPVALPHPPEPSAKPSKRRLPVAARMGAAAVAVALAGWLLVGHNREPAPRSGPPQAPERLATPAPGPARGAPVPAARLAPASALDVDAGLYLARAGQTFSLGGGGQVQPGDQLFLEIRSDHALVVHVFAEDEQGEVFALFPMAGFDTANPLAAGVRHRLPGRQGGEVRDWQVTSAGGREHVLVIAAREPLAVVEAAWDRLARGEALPPDSARSPVPIPRRGIGATRPSAAPASSAPRLAALARQLESAQAEGRVWLRQFTLDNPAPR